MIQVCNLGLRIGLLALLALASLASAPHELIKFTISTYILPDKSLTMELDVATPRSPNLYPPILFMAGLEGLVPSYFQSGLINSIAEQGYIFITVSKLQSPNPQKVTQTLSKVVQWINQNFQSVLSNRVPGVTADFKDRYILMGHSAGGHVTTEYLNSTCGDFKLHILIDGVDGADPFGIKKDYIITPGKMLPYATPVLVLASQLDPAAKGLNPPCAPTFLSNERFYNAMSGPKWFLNVSKYGHIDFYDMEYRDMGSMMCPTCHKDCNFTQYKQLVKDAVLHFINAIMYKNTISLAIIEDAKFKIPTSFKHDHMNYDVKRGGFCERVKAQYQQVLNLARQE